MDVSVIFATHNREDVLEQVFEAWRAVDAQTECEYEIICSDDESTDNTVKIIESIKDLPIKLLRNKKGGASKARNAALQIATGKIVIFTGDDMFPEPDYINRHYENYLKFGENIATLGRIEWHPDIKMNYLMHHITNVGCEQFGFIGLPAYQLIDYRHFYTSNISVPMSQLKKLDKFFNTDFDKYGFEDIEFGYRLEQNGMKIYYDPDIAITHHHVYNSVDKFCVRHETAGEELVVFHDLQPGIEDKCIYDIEDMRRVFELYKKKHGKGISVSGYMEMLGINLAKKITKGLEKIIVWNKPSKLNRLQSVLYAGIFKFHFLLGCVKRLAQNEDVHWSKLVQFAFLYTKKSYAKIYWDTGYGMNETESRRWMCWDSADMVIEKELPDNLKALRISPLKDRCTMELKELLIETVDGERIVPQMEWHNAKKTNWTYFDFRNTKDPQIVIDRIPENYKKIIVKMSVKSMGRNSFYKVLRSAAFKLKQRVKTCKANREEWTISYVSGQPRRIQICVDGMDEKTRTELVDRYREATAIFGDSILVSDMRAKQRDFITYLYKPEKEPLDALQMRQVAYLILNAAYDYVLVSKSYAEFPEIGCKKIEDVLIYLETLAGDAEQWIQHANGRYVRLLSYEKECETVNIKKLYKEIKLQQEYLLTCNKNYKPIFRQSLRSFSFEKEKPVVFVVPIFLAVGGVERNTIEVMRALKADYTFCLLTMERHTAEQGSLHYQLEGICDYVFDMRELTEHDNYLACLYELKQIFNPDVLWLCNNSPWFEVHTTQICKVFYDVAMIAQDVYDTKVGWIEYYSNPENKLYDRYIAVTQLIKDTFMKKYSLPEEKIDTIYSVIDGEKIKNELEHSKTRDSICEKYHLNKEQMQFAFVGRLTEQKNPMRYVKMVETLMKKGCDDLHFVMVGDGVLGDEVDNYICEHDLSRYITRIPFIDNTPEFISMLDGLILTSRYEGMPIVSIEAMCMSTPIFSTDTGDLARFLNRNENGLIIDESKSDVENFEMFLQDLEKYSKNATLHSEEMLNYFSAENIAKLYRETFRKGMEVCKNKLETK